MTAADEYAVRLRAYYDSRAGWHRVYHRLSGILIILVGAGLPVLTNLDYPAKATVVSLAGMVIAVLTGLHAFYRWDQSWILLRNTEAAVTAAYWAWRTNLPKNGTNNTDKQTVELTNAFLGQLAQIRAQEAKTFFENVTPPGTAQGTTR
ncbi:DUF4231 domain-containing protein [Kibdelosporangium banguiense]|uniref:DUF4231 domain-containing protein n=1 Tax=Kibdelosporangium banguiense TaxID=1365924 RepID=UPI0027DBBAAC|nr:DUF4231 domain-containing protein [Kibdelosporangium banguiense]